MHEQIIRKVNRQIHKRDFLKILFPNEILPAYSNRMLKFKVEMASDGINQLVNVSCEWIVDKSKST